MYELSQLAHLDTILARETNIDNIVGIRAQVETLRVYAVNIGKSKEECKEIAMARIKSERRAGQLLLSMPKRNGARPPDTGFIDTNPCEIEGVKPSQRNSWQWIARLPDDVFEDLMIGCIQNAEQEITTAFFYKAAKIHMMRSNGINTDRPQQEQQEYQATDDFKELFRYAFFKGVKWRAWNPPVDVEDAIEEAIEAWESNNNIRKAQKGNQDE
jgi:hypothetical protein